MTETREAPTPRDPGTVSRILLAIAILAAAYALLVVQKVSVRVVDRESEPVWFV